MMLERIEPTHPQIETLFLQLTERTYAISHRNNPSFEEHKNFVVNHPYRAWFIINDNEKPIGNVYIHTDNSIGLNCPTEICEDGIKLILGMITERYSPFHEIPSVRYGNYFLNVSTENSSLQQKLLNLGLTESQRTYVFPINKHFSNERK